MTFNEFIKDYPALLSTCHSLRDSIADGYLLDYLIIDEASQVSLLLAGLAMSCARYVVVVGDQRQLPRVFAATAAARRPTEKGTQVPVRRHHLDRVARHHRRAALRAPDGEFPSAAFVVYNRVTNQPLLAIEVDGFAFHENNPDQRARDALKDEILDAHQMPLLRLPTTGSREHQQIRQALDNAGTHWARLSTR